MGEVRLLFFGSFLLVLKSFFKSSHFSLTGRLLCDAGMLQIQQYAFTFLMMGNINISINILSAYLFEHTHNIPWLLSFSWTGTPKILKLSRLSFVRAFPNRYEPLDSLASVMLHLVEAYTLRIYYCIYFFFFVEYCLKIFNKHRTYVMDN